MDYDNYITFYIGLLAIQMTAGSIIAAGLIALIQSREKQSPRRNISLIFNPIILVIYFVVLAGLALLTSLSAWALLGSHDIIKQLDLNSVGIALSEATTMLTTLLTIFLSIVFFYILWRSKALLDAGDYLKAVRSSFKSQDFSDYLFNRYSSKPYGFVDFVISVVGELGEDTYKQKAETEKKEAAKKKAEQDIKNWEERSERTSNAVNPLAIFSEYCLSNASSNTSQVEQIGLPLIEEILTEYIDKANEDRQYIYPYLNDLTVDMREALQEKSLAVQKRFITLLKNLSIQLCESKEFGPMKNVAQNIHVFTKGSQVEEIKTFAVGALRNITDRYSAINAEEKDWRKFDGDIEELALVVARIAEGYYHNVTALTPVSVIENNRTEINDLSSEIGNYYYQFEKLHEKYPEILPVIIFDAVDITAEALIGAMKRSPAVAENRGLSASRYERTAGTLYSVFDSYADAAIKNQSEELLQMCIYRMERGMSFLSRNGIEDIRVDLADTLATLGIKIAADKKLKDFKAYGGKSITQEIADIINEYADFEKLNERRSSIEHYLFLVQDKEAAKAFKAQIGWY